jgi:hypothetical protein
MSSAQEVGKKYVALVKEGKYEKCLEELFSNDAESIEAAASPTGERITKGLAAIQAKGKTWGEANTVHKQEIFGPYPNDNRFAVRFVYELTNKPSGQRMTMDEVGLFSVENGKITREEFFYSVG